MKLVTKDGKPVDLNGVDDKVKAVLEAAFEGITHQMTAAMAATLKPIEQQLAAFNPQQLTELRELIEKQGKPATEEPTTNTTAETTDPAIKLILDEIKALREKQDALETSTKDEREAKSAMDRTVAYIEKHLPNLKGKDAIISRIAATKPKDEDAVKAAIEREREYQEQLVGKEPVEKLFSADPAAEGGDEGSKDGSEEAEVKEKTDRLEARLKN